MNKKIHILPLYFGCYEEPGHFVIAKNLRRVSSDDVNRIYLQKHDAKLPPQGLNQKEGVYSWLFVDSKTIISFWDRSVDSRHGSHSTFMFEGRLARHVAVSAIEIHFPTIFSRFNFDLTWIGAIR